MGAAVGSAPLRVGYRRLSNWLGPLITALY